MSNEKQNFTPGDDRMITLRMKGDWNKTHNWINRMLKRDYMKVVHRYAQKGVEALQKATPKDTGHTANCWEYHIEEKSGEITIVWTNTNENKGVNIALILQYGHGTGTGGYVTGIDYINPAMRPYFEYTISAIWKEIIA